MKLRQEFAELIDDLLDHQVTDEGAALDAALEVVKAKSDHATMIAVEGAAIRLAARRSELAYLLGLEHGRDIRRLVCE